MPKTTKMTNLRGEGLRICYFVVCPLLLAHLGPQKAKDKKNNKSLTLGELLFLLFVPFSLPTWAPRRPKTTKIANPRRLRDKITNP